MVIVNSRILFKQIFRVGIRGVSEMDEVINIKTY